MRAVKCVVGSYGSVMDDTECNAATRPTDTQVRRTLSSFLPFLDIFLLLLSAARNLFISSSLWERTVVPWLNLKPVHMREGSIHVHAYWHSKHTQTNTHISFPPGLNKAMLSGLEGKTEGEVILASLSPHTLRQNSQTLQHDLTVLFFRILLSWLCKKHKSLAQVLFVLQVFTHLAHTFTSKHPLVMTAVLGQLPADLNN